THIDAVFAAQISDAFHTFDENSISGEQPVHFGMHRRESLDELANLVDPGVVDIERDATDTSVAGMESLSRSCFDNVVNQLALIKEIQECSEPTQVERAGSCVKQVILNSHQFGQDRPQVLAAWG